MTTGSLAVLERAEQMLAEVATAQDAANLIDMAEAARLFAKQARLGTASVNHATAIKLKAEIRLAECVEAGQAAGEIAKQGNQPSGKPSSEEGLECGPATFADLGLTHKQVHESRKIRQQYTPEQIDATIAEATAQDVTVARKDFIKGTAHVSHNSGENEWYTPAPILEAARLVLGGIDLDPASSDLAQQTVKAERWFTAQTDGLASDWGDAAAIWMNPPYAQPLIGRFVAKFCDHLASAGCGIALVNNGTDTAWGARLLGDADAVCFPTGRIRFVDQAGNPSGAPLQGQMIAYIGRDADGFAAAFAGIGPVLRG